MKVIFHLISFFILATPVCAAVEAPSSPITPVEGAQMAKEAEQVVQSSLDQIFAALKAEKTVVKTDTLKVRQIVNQHFVPHFDVPFMSMFIVGVEWHQIKKEEVKKTDAIASIRDWLIRTYTPAIQRYDGQTVTLLPTNKDDINIAKKQVIVQSKLLDQGKEYLIKYYLHNVEGGWKVWDISLDGVRLLLNFRSQFKELVSKHKLDGALQKLKIAPPAVTPITAPVPAPPAVKPVTPPATQPAPVAPAQPAPVAPQQPAAAAQPTA